MTLHYSDAAVEAQAQKLAKKKSRKYVLGVGIAVLLASGTAFAAVRLYGYGTIESSEATVKNLGVSNTKLTGPLVPGVTVGGQATVTNTNDYTVKVTHLLVKDAITITNKTCDLRDLQLAGQAADFPGTAGDFPGSGTSAHKIDVKPWVTVPAGATRTVVAPELLSQRSTAVGLCAVKLDFAVQAQVGDELH